MNMTGLLLLAAASAAVPIPAEIKSFADWSVGCDNGRACQAVSLMDMETSENQLTLIITRGPDRADQAKISIANVENAPPGGTLSFAVDGTKIVRTVKVPDAGNPVEMPLDPELFGAIRSGRALILRDDSGKFYGRASLSGLVAALSYVDGQQRRTGGVTALVAPGPVAANGMPAPPTLPSVGFRVTSLSGLAKPSAAELAKLRQLSGCDGSTDSAPTAESAQLDDKRLLVLLSCGSGAYNVSFAPYILSGKGVRRKASPAPFDYVANVAEPGAPALLVNAGWDAKSAQLSSYNKGRGLGDCGSAETFVWDGKKFRLIEQRVMDQCRGVINWIPSWRAKLVRKK
jgi:hypothetical protein